MYPAPKQVALVFAVLLKRTGKTRARISEKSFRVLSGRTTIRPSFTLQVIDWLEDFGVLMVRLERGGFALIAISALEGAPSVKGSEFVAEEKKQLLAGNLPEDKLLDELGLDASEDED